MATDNAIFPVPPPDPSPRWVCEKHRRILLEGEQCAFCMEEGTGKKKGGKA